MKSEIKNIKKKYISLGIKKGQNLYITADFGKIVDKEKLNYKTLNNHFRVIKEIIGTNGTMVVPTATLNLCKTKIVFDPKHTESYNMGSFSEFIRRKKESKRTFHPLWSVSANGKLASYFTKNISRHAFGHDSIWPRMLKKNTYSLHIGVDPRKSISIIHYIELVSGVPYRFTKGFQQYVLRGRKKTKEEFFHFCIKDEKKLIRDNNVKIFKNFSKKSKLKKINFGRGKITLFNLNDFFELTVNYLVKNPYGWTRKILK